jgi:hypothetical protein
MKPTFFLACLVLLSQGSKTSLETSFLQVEATTALTMKTFDTIYESVYVFYDIQANQYQIVTCDSQPIDDDASWRDFRLNDFQALGCVSVETDNVDVDNLTLVENVVDSNGNPTYRVYYQGYNTRDA